MALLHPVRGSPLVFPKEQLRLGSRESISQALLSDQQANLGIGEQKAEPLGRVRRVQRQIGPSGLENSQYPDNHLQRALQAKPNQQLGSHTEGLQMMGQLVSASVELLVGKLLVFKGHGYSVWRPLHLRLKEGVYALVLRVTGPGSVPLNEEPFLLLPR